MQIRPRQLILSCVVILACALPAQAESLRMTSNVIWSRAEPWFGGFSGLEVSADGTQISTITDRSNFIRANLIRKNDTITAIQFMGKKALKYANGARLKNENADSEGLALATSGMAYVSFEHSHRVARLNMQTGVTHRLPSHPDFAAFPNNSGLEALAIHPNGMLYTLPETSATQRTPFPLFAFDGTAWRKAHDIPRRGPFRPVGADFDSDGRLYLLERALTPLGFRSRIRRFDLTTPDLAETSMLTTYPGQFDNLEAISLWHDRSGATRITMISDDNFLRIQRTQIVEYILDR